MNTTVENARPTVRNLVGVKDLAEAWGLSTNGVRDAFKNHGLPSIKIGKRRLFDIERANEWLAAREAEAVANPSTK